MHKNDSRRKRAARIMALILAAAMIASTGIYLFMFFGTLVGYESDLGTAYAAESITIDVSGMELSALDKDRLTNIGMMMRFINLNYKDEKSYSELIEAMYSGIFDSLDDKWSEYYFKGDKTLEKLEDELNNEFFGIGMVCVKTAKGILIEGTTEGGPAAKAGIQPGGYLIRVNSTDVSEMDVNEVVKLIRGPENTEVEIRISYLDGVKTYTLTRARIVAPSVKGEMLEGNVGYIDINSFADATGREFRTAAMDLKAKGMESLIIDLRNNGGGYADSAWYIASLLIPKGVAGYYISRGEVIETFKAKGSELDTMPIVVLVNGNSASASEILTAALKDAGRATVVGEVTYGKGIAQGVYKLANGDSFKMSTIYFTGSSKQSIHQAGIVPDLIVYPYGGYSESEASALVSGIVTLKDDERYYEGEEGLNVLAAQQRLRLLGYDVEYTGIMDSKTMDALRKVQKAAGSYSYGNLDNFTIGALREQFNALLGIDRNGGHADVQLEKAVETARSIQKK